MGSQGINSKTGASQEMFEIQKKLQKQHGKVAVVLLESWILERKGTGPGMPPPLF